MVEEGSRDGETEIVFGLERDLHYREAISDVSPLCFKEERNVYYKKFPSLVVRHGTY
jgi:hypothetical protein